MAFKVIALSDIEDGTVVNLRVGMLFIYLSGAVSEENLTGELPKYIPLRWTG